ncbi:hypothetical protein CTI12_AA506040 [Artemisia annua]|uniref:Eukaryotic translation initiation factor 2 subunit beta n=1 Tax=Artemisia annua TaxID=35608 RepID=A0A2U1LCG2_ARTAN|nr:hypothetical protein CTI12_AA506040 [Artemisia annua]
MLAVRPVGGKIRIADSTYLIKMAAVNYQQAYAQRMAQLSRTQREHENERRAMSPPRVLREGTKKSVVVNFKDLCERMHRQPEHVMSYLLAELNSTGSLDGHQRFVVNGKLAPKTIEGILKQYVDNYVICEYCKNPNTVLSKQDNKLVVNCEKDVQS